MKKTTWVFFLYKYRKLRSISLEFKLEHKLFILQVWVVNLNSDYLVSFFFAAECNIAEFACFPFDVPPNDPQPNFGTCRNFQRSLLSAKDLNCQIGAREVGR